MKVLVQWARSNPSDWEEIDSADWASQPDRGKSSGVVSNPGAQAGWVNQVCVQGVVFAGDAIAVEDLDDGSGGVRVTLINEDASAGWTRVTRYARVMTLLPYGPDSRFGGAINTRQSQIVYSDDPVFDTPVENTVVRPWSDFVPPDASVQRFGVTLPDAIYQAHMGAVSLRGWREWNEGLDPSELDRNGHVRQQRAQGRYLKPLGTRTFYHNATDSATAIHVATNENQVGLTPAGAVTENSGNVTTDLIGWASSTASGQPNSAAWPYGNYRHQIDCVAADVDLRFGLLNQGASQGHFARVNSTLTTGLETKQQIQAVFSGSGLKLATTGLVSWTPGAATDRFELTISVLRATGMGNKSIDLQLGETDDFADGPWLNVGEVGAFINDTVAVTDAVAVTRERARSNSDSAAVTDQVVATATFERQATDVVAVTDQVQRVHDASRTIDDSISVVDQVTAEPQNATQDAIAVVDQVATELSFSRDVSDTISVADQVATELSFERDATDAILVADATTIELSYGRDASDSITVADNTTTVFEYGRTVSDVVSVADLTQAETVYVREVNDAVSVVDQVTAEPQTDTQDAIAVVDQVTTELNFSREATDAIAVVDQVTTELSYAREASDSVTVTDDTDIEVFISRSDAVSVTDAVATEMQFGRTVSDAVSTVDQVEREKDTSRTVDDVVSVTDQTQASSNYARTASDAISVTDQTSIEVVASESDSVDVTDQIQRVHDASRTIDDSVSTADQVATEIVLAESESDNVAVTDQVQATLDFSRDVSDVVATVDQVAIELSYALTFSDSVGVIDEVERGFVKDTTETDTVEVVDQVATSFAYSRSVSDVVSVVDDLDIQAELIVVEDEVVIEFTKGAYAADSIETTDFVSASIEFVNPDAIETEDEVSRDVFFVRDIDDVIFVEEVGPLLGEPILLVHSIDGGISDGPVFMSTVSPDGPLTISSGSSCDATPVGFVVVTGDHVEWNDKVEVEVA